MNIVIVGVGKVGTTLADQLSKEGYDIIVIDNDTSVIEAIVDRLDVKGVIGNGASYETQMEAGVDTADLLIAATSSDEVNILSCMVARKVGVKHTIARVRNPEYSKQLHFMKEELGLSMVVNPEYSAAQEISRMLRFPSAIKIETFAKGKVDLVEIKLNEHCPFLEDSIVSLKDKFNLHILICAVIRKDEVIIPSGDFLMQKGDRIYVIASPQELIRLFKIASLQKEKVKSIMIVGGGKISYYLTQLLHNTGIHVKIIEQNAERCRELGDLLDDVMVIEGDGTSQDLLQEEGIEKMDAFVALTGIDEENIIISLYAGTKHINKVITKVNRIEFAGMLETMGIESVISPKQIAANDIIRYVRAMQNTVGDHVQTLYRLFNNQIEALEFQVLFDSSLVAIPLKEMKLKNNILIASIIRQGTVIVPDGESQFEHGDTVIVVTKDESFDDLSDILL